MMMNQINLNSIVESLSEDFSLNLKGVTYSDRIEIRPVDIEYGIGFRIRVQIEWRELTAEFIPDNFSSDLISSMGAAESHKKNIFMQLMNKWASKTNGFNIKINGSQVSLQDRDFWDQEWKHCLIKLIKAPISRNDLDNLQLENEIFKISSDLLGMILSLLPLEERENEENHIGLPEGALTRITVNRFERNSFNRQACIKIHGYSCKVCKFNFEDKYGELGKGYIHVHHIVPVSEMGAEYKINPAKDLVPLCPNCHSMVHKKNPPYSIEELKDIMKNNQY